MDAWEERAVNTSLRAVQAALLWSGVSTQLIRIGGGAVGAFSKAAFPALKCPESFPMLRSFMGQGAWGCGRGCMVHTVLLN